jgi:hypothetical protein
MAQDSSASGIQKSSQKAVVQDRDISRTSRGEGRRCWPPQNNKRQQRRRRRLANKPG